jgi:DNA ligase (NAD+)
MAEPKMEQELNETRLTVLLREAAAAGNKEEVVSLLTLCDDIYYSGKAHKYRGNTYSLTDIPSDDVYRAYRKEFTPDVDTAALFVRGKMNVRKDEIIPHDYPMGSLTKFDSSNIAKLQTIFTRMGNEPDVIAVTLKLDGVSLQSHFIEGRLIKAVTRYDHKSGRSVMDVAERFVTRPDPSFVGKLVINGEVVLRGDVYKQLGFAHPRNGVSGILSRKSISDAHFLDYIIFDFTAYEPTEGDVLRGWPANKPKLASDQFELLKKLGYEPAPIKLVGRDSLSEEKLNLILNEMRAATNIPSDGLVVCPNAWATESTDPPKMKVAYKGPSAGDWTVVVGIDPRATRTGNVIPQVTVEPVHVGGVVITSIAGANYFILQEKKICIGSRVLVVKSKEVIPFIETVDNEQVEIVCHPAPTTCPACNTAVVAKERMLTCPNPSCPAKAVGQVSCFLDTIGLKGVGKKRLDSLKVDSIHDLYSMSVFDMMQTPGIGPKIAQSIYDQLRSCINPIGEATLLAAIGPPLIREKTAELVVGSIHIEELFGETPVPIARLQGIKGIGPERAGQLLNFHQEGRTLIQLLLKHGLTITLAARAAASSSSAPSSTGATVEVVCLTGKGSRTRSDYEHEITKKGWINVAAVSGKVTLVVTDDLAGTTSKLEKARSLNKKIVTYEEFEQMLAS